MPHQEPDHGMVKKLNPNGVPFTGPAMFVLHNGVKSMQYPDGCIEPLEKEVS